jgi:heat shock protein HtpX
MFSIQQELECYAACITDSTFLPLIWILILFASLLFAIYFLTKTPIIRIASFTAAQFAIISSIAATASAMQCSQMLTLEIYVLYVLLSSALILLLPRIYYRVLIKRYRARQIADIMDWPQDFVNTLIEGAKVYYYDSAIPRAFASGKVIFVSMGMLEMMDEIELKAILAHEIWHLRHNSKTPILKQLSLMTFTKNRSEHELELLADFFAGEIAGKDSVESARAKLN